MEVLHTILTIVQVILAVGLVVIVTVQSGKSAGLSAAIGGGDGFSGGLLYGVLNGWAPDKCLQFGWASGVLAASSLNDYAEPADEKQVWDIYKGNARVQR